jgi:capsular polysaccharide biosynthesis protein
MEKEIDLKELFGIIWQNIIKIILATLVCAAMAFLITYFWVTPMYTASVSMYVTNNENRSDTAITNGDLTASQGLVDTYIVVLESDTLLSKTAEALPYSYSTEELRRMISAEAINNTEAFRINVENADPTVAQTIANAVAKVTPDEIKRVVKAGSVEVIDYAKLPVKADWPVARNTAIGALVGLFAAILVAVVSAMLDSVIRTEEDLPDELGVPIIGVIPSMNGSARKGGY